MFNIRALYEIM